MRENLDTWLRFLERSSPSLQRNSSMFGSSSDLELVALLRKLDLEDIIPVFEKAAITTSLLMEMSEKDLQDLGIPFGPRRVILKSLKKQTALSTAHIEDIEVSN
jgi:hypothetical protein